MLLLLPQLFHFQTRRWNNTKSEPYFFFSTLRRCKEKWIVDTHSSPTPQLKTRCRSTRRSRASSTPLEEWRMRMRMRIRRRKGLPSTRWSTPSGYRSWICWWRKSWRRSRSRGRTPSSCRRDASVVAVSAADAAAVLLAVVVAVPFAVPAHRSLLGKWLFLMLLLLRWSLTTSRSP